MAFEKNKLTRFNVIANYHTITKINIDLSSVSTPILDENNSVTGYVGGSKTYITLASYKDKASFDIRSFSLESKTYEMDFTTAYNMTRSEAVSLKAASYAFIKLIDSYWNDVETIED